jgi:hypothetical protein
LRRPRHFSRVPQVYTVEPRYAAHTRISSAQADAQYQSGTQIANAADQIQQRLAPKRASTRGLQGNSGGGGRRRARKTTVVVEDDG